MGWPATLWWISTFGSRSARSDGRSIANGSQARVRLIGPSASSSDPAAPAAQLVAGAVDDQPARRQPRLHQRPRVAHRLDRILAQHVEGAHQNRCPPGQFEAAEPEFHAVARRRHSIRVDLKADDADVGADRPQPGGELERRHRQRAVTEVDDQRVGGCLQRDAHPPRVHQPAVAAAQPVVARGAARELADRGAHGLSLCP